MNVTSLFVAFPLFSLSCRNATQIFASAHHSAFIVFSTFIAAAAAAFAFFLGFFSDTVACLRRHCCIRVVLLLFLSGFRFFFCVVLNASHFESRACWEVSVNIFEFVSAASFAGVSVCLLDSLCCCLSLTAHSLTFFSSFQADLSTAHSRCDDFFDCHFSICSSTSASMSWYLMYIRVPILACLYHSLTFDRYVLQSSWISRLEECCVSHEYSF